MKPTINVGKYHINILANCEVYGLWGNKMIKLIFGILFLCGGLAIMTIGGYMAKDGWEALTKLKDKTSAIQSKILKPQEEKLLSVIYKYQKDFGLNKLIIYRTDGVLFFDNEEQRKKYQINIIAEVYNITKEYQSYSQQLEALILSIPEDYLRQIPENRWDSPYVIAITEKGIEYLKSKISP